MKVHAPVLAVLSLLPSTTCAQKVAKNPAQEPKETDICQILSKPYPYNNTIVKIRAYMETSWEFSMLMDERCGALWLGFADGSAPPELVAIVNGNGTAGGKDADGRQIPPISIRLLRDSNWEQLAHYMNQNAKAQECGKEPAPDLDHLSDCTTYRITATFTGRIDAVSKSVYESRRKRKTGDKIDWKGFGHMGMFDAQIVVKTVEDVVAVDELELRNSTSGTH